MGSNKQNGGTTESSATSADTIPTDVVTGHHHFRTYQDVGAGGCYAARGMFQSGQIAFDFRRPRPALVDSDPHVRDLTNSSRVAAKRSK